MIGDKTLVPPHPVERTLADVRNGIDSVNHPRNSVQNLRRNLIAISFETKTRKRASLKLSPKSLSLGRHTFQSSAHPPFTS
jgi:hypothetical protein